MKRLAGAGCATLVAGWLVGVAYFLAWLFDYEDKP